MRPTASTLEILWQWHVRNVLFIFKVNFVHFSWQDLPSFHLLSLFCFFFLSFFLFLLLLILYETINTVIFKGLLSLAWEVWFCKFSNVCLMSRLVELPLKQTNKKIGYVNSTCSSMPQDIKSQTLQVKKKNCVDSFEFDAKKRQKNDRRDGSQN